VTTRLAALAATLGLLAFPAAAMADDTTVSDAEQPAAAPAEQPAAAPAAEAPAQPTCLAAKGGGDDLSIRGVRVGAKTRMRDADGKPLAATSLSYCVTGGGEVSFSVSNDQEVVLIMSTADGDSIGPINPTSPALSARAEFPAMKRIARAAGTTVYRVDNRRQLLLGIAGGRVTFVAAADRLLLDYPSKLGYHLRRLGV
jgi:putative hemolysin